MKSVRSMFILPVLLVILGLCPARGQEGMDQIIVMNTEGTIRSRVGCMEVLTCSGVGDRIEWRRFGQRVPLGNTTNRMVTVTSSADGTQWRSDLIFNPVMVENRAAYTCTISGTEPITITVLLFVEEAPAEIIPTIPNFDVSNFTVGSRLTVGCPVDTCVDVTVTFLVEDTVLAAEEVEQDETGTSVYNVNIEVNEDTAGTYACKVDIPDFPDSGIMQEFNITGSPIPPTTAPTDTTEPTTMPTTTPTQSTPSGGSSGSPSLASPSSSPTETPTIATTEDEGDAALSFTAHFSLVLTLLATSLAVLLV